MQKSRVVEPFRQADAGNGRLRGAGRPPVLLPQAGEGMHNPYTRLTFAVGDDASIGIKLVRIYAQIARLTILRKSVIMLLNFR